MIKTFSVHVVQRRQTTIHASDHVSMLIACYFRLQIRAKEAASRAVKAKDSGKIQMLTALPQMVFILRSYFSVAKKPAISWKQVTAKIVESSSTFSTG